MNRNVSNHAQKLPPGNFTRYEKRMEMVLLTLVSQEIWTTTQTYLAPWCWKLARMQHLKNGTCFWTQGSNGSRVDAVYLFVSLHPFWGWFIEAWGCLMIILLKSGCFCCWGISKRHHKAKMGFPHHYCESIEEEKLIADSIPMIPNVHSSPSSPKNKIK